MKATVENILYVQTLFITRRSRVLTVTHSLAQEPMCIATKTLHTATLDESLSLLVV